MTPDEYVAGMGERMAADGCEVFQDRIGNHGMLVGQRKDFLPAALSRLHLITAALVLPAVSGADVVQFASDVSQYAKQRTGAMLGLQSGIGAFSVIVSGHVGPDAIEAALAKPRLQFAVRVQSVVVDTGAGVAHTFTGRQVVGYAFNGHLRRKRELYVTAPA
jgi:hypothetical protein